MNFCKIAFLAFFILINLSGAFAQAEEDCELAFFTKAYENYARDLPWYKRPFVRLVRKAVERDLRRACPNLETCDPEKFIGMLRPFIKNNILSRFYQIRGYGLLFSVMVASAAGTSYLTSLLPSGTQFLSVLITSVTTIGIYVVGRPLLMPLSSKIQRAAFGVTGKGTSLTSDLSVSDLDAQWWLTQQTLNPNAQWARNIWGNARKDLRAGLLDMLRILNEKAHTNTAIQIAAAQFADMAVTLRRLHPDVPYDNPDLLRVLDASFLDHFALPKDFRAYFFSFVKKYVAQAGMRYDPAVYEGLYTVWFERKHDVPFKVVEDSPETASGTEN